MLKMISILLFFVLGLNAAEADKRTIKQEKKSTVRPKEIKIPPTRTLNPVYPRGSIATH